MSERKRKGVTPFLYFQLYLKRLRLEKVGVGKVGVGKVEV
jgi:hypothetical protein